MADETTQQTGQTGAQTGTITAPMQTSAQQPTDNKLQEQYDFLTNWIRFHPPARSVWENYIAGRDEAAPSQAATSSERTPSPESGAGEPDEQKDAKDDREVQKFMADVQERMPAVNPTITRAYDLVYSQLGKGDLIEGEKVFKDKYEKRLGEIAEMIVSGDPMKKLLFLMKAVDAETTARTSEDDDDRRRLASLMNGRTAESREVATSGERGGSTISGPPSPASDTLEGAVNQAMKQYGIRDLTELSRLMQTR